MIESLKTLFCRGDMNIIKQMMKWVGFFNEDLHRHLLVSSIYTDTCKIDVLLINYIPYRLFDYVFINDIQLSKGYSLVRKCVWTENRG